MSFMMKVTWLFFIFAVIFTGKAFAQVAGNSIYDSPNNGSQKTNAPNLGNLYFGYTQSNATFIEAYVLMNIKADEYIATLALEDEAKTVREAHHKIDTRIKEFTKTLNALGISEENVVTDFVTQTKTYDFSASGSSFTVQEKETGFAVKKNVIVRYKDRNLLEKITALAAQQSIFDLVKVDYAVADPDSMRGRLFEEASRIVKKKEEKYHELLGIRSQKGFIEIEQYDVKFPPERYRSYQAYETGNVQSGVLTTVVEKRKVKTFYYNPIEFGQFDRVVNPIVTEPVIQFTLYMKVRYPL
jgi:uncharacterized protein YggE